MVTSTQTGRYNAKVKQVDTKHVTEYWLIRTAAADITHCPFTLIICFAFSSSDSIVVLRVLKSARASEIAILRFYNQGGGPTVHGPSRG